MILKEKKHFMVYGVIILDIILIFLLSGKTRMIINTILLNGWMNITQSYKYFESTIWNVAH